MAGSTPIYGFPYPESSDLVANYPALGQDLAEDIETVIAALPPGGLAHVATESFSAVSSVSLNNVFTSAYENYLVVLKILGSASGSTSLRLRASGTDNSAASYVAQRLVGAGASAYGETYNTTSFSSIITAQTTNSGTTITFFSPQLAAATAVLVNSGRYDAITQYSGIHNVSSAFDGFSLFPASGTITGTVRVYGYQNS